MAFDLVTYLIGIVVSTIVIAPALWLSGRLIVGARKARFSDAILIVVIGTVIGGLVGAFFSGIIGSIVQLILWLALVRHYFDCGWFTAFIIAIIAVIAFIVVGVILGIIGFTLFSALLDEDCEEGNALAAIDSQRLTAVCYVYITNNNPNRVYSWSRDVLTVSKYPAFAAVTKTLIPQLSIDGRVC